MKKVMVFLMVCCLVFSCTKPNECGKNCVDIRIQGQIKNMEDNIGIPNVPVTIAWNSYIKWLGTSDVISITKGNTDKSGNYDFVVAIDSSLFRHNYVNVEIPSDITFLYTGCNSEADKQSYRITSIYDGNFLFAAYPKAILNLKVVHLTNSTLSSGEVGCSFGQELNKNYDRYRWFDRNSARDTLIKIETRSGVLTRIYWNKYAASGQITSFQDSIICKKNVESNFQVTF
jgi:hypothetical protein